MSPACGSMSRMALLSSKRRHRTRRTTGATAWMAFLAGAAQCYWATSCFMQPIKVVLPTHQVVKLELGFASV